MRNVPPQAAMIAAVGILGAGAAWAGSMFLSEPEPSTIQPQQIRELAAKVQSAPAPAPTLVVPASAAVVRPQMVAPDKPKKSGAVVTQVVQRIPIVQPTVKKPEAPAPPAAPEDPVKNLALMGVTHESNTDRAWLVDLASKEKEAVAVGDSAFGFTVKKISGETVTLGRGPSEYTLRLGEKQLPVIVTSASGDSSGGSEDGDDGNPFGRGRDRDGRNPFGGPGGPGGFGDFRSRFAGGFPGFGGFGGSSSGWSGRSWGGGDSGRSWGSSSDSNRGSDNRWSSSNSGRSSWGGGGSSWGGGGFGGGGFSGFGGGGSWNGSSGRSSQTGFAGATSTSNPQTSRRNGARLTGGVTSAQETPAAITNPQTQRRNGSSSGQAFGQENTNGRNSNNNSNNRLGYGR